MISSRDGHDHFLRSLTEAGKNLSSCIRQTPCGVPFTGFSQDIPGRNIGKCLLNGILQDHTGRYIKILFRNQRSNPINRLLNQCLSGTGQAQQLFGAVDPLRGQKRSPEPPAIIMEIYC